MTKARRDGLSLLLMGSLVFLLLGTLLDRASDVPMQDFRVVYFPARCLIEHGDPYKESDVLRVYKAEGGEQPKETSDMRQCATRNVYLPTAFSFTVPFAMLSWGPGHALWLILTAGGFLVASFLVWNSGADYAPVLCGCLIGFLLANSEVIFVYCNPAGIAVSLCVVAVWCFLQGRFAAAGVLCLAVSLAIKPQDTGLVWLYFLLAGGVYRKRALQTLLVTVVIGVPAVLWAWHAGPNWIQEWQSNLAAFSAHGGINDPSPASSGAHGLAMVISLQAMISVFRDDPRIYNPVSYLVCGPMLLLWIRVTLRSRFSPQRAWLALAAVAALTMLPVYHRQYDAKLLLLTVPACVMLWAERGLIGWLALAINAVGFMLTGDLPWVILLGLIKSLHLPTTGVPGQIVMAVQVFPVPLIVLLTGIFYLWVYASRSSAGEKSAGAGRAEEEEIAPAPLGSGS